MMICPKCGSVVDDNCKFCASCGAALMQQEPAQPQYQQPQYQQPQYQQPQYQQPQYQQPQYQQPPYGAPQYQYGAPADPYHGHPMKWYKFLIYFALFAGAVLNIFSAISYFTGSSYGSDAGLYYSYFPGLKAADIVFGIIVIGVAVLMIYTRMALAKFKKNGPKLLYLTYGVSLGVTIIYLIAVSVIIGSAAALTSSIPSIGTSLAFLVINMTYFRKRMDLFVN